MKSFRGKQDRRGRPTEWRAEEALRARIDHLQTAIDSLLEGFQIIDRNWRYVYVNPTAARHGRTTVDRLLYRTMTEAYPGIERSEMFSVLKRCMNEQVSARFENQFAFPHDGAAWFELSVEPVPEGICVLSVDITARKEAESQLDRRLSELEAVNRVSTAMRAANSLGEMLPVLLKETLDVLHLDQGIVWLYDPVKNELRPAVTRGYDESRPVPPPEKPGEGFAGQTIVSGRPEISNDLHRDERLPEPVRQHIPPGSASVAVAIRTSNAVVGAFTVGSSGPRVFTPYELELLTTLSEMAGNAIQRMKLHEETERRLRHLSALREIDLAITTSFDLRRNLKTILEQVTRELDADAADVLLISKGSGHLRYAGGHGFRSSEVEHTNLRIGEGIAGTAVLERATKHVSNLREDASFARAVLVNVEDLVGYHCAPLITRGEVIGVLEVFDRKEVERNQEWMDFLNALAGQTAIAAEVSSLFDRLQRSTNELLMAYDATIEGWSRALDLRDKETEGHTQRVTEMTVRLAQASGMSEDELAQVRWGGLLHDIGKMGVPDAILLKPGPLTDDEWGIMRRHPTFAFEMLAPIRYLRNAIDIPYCHHEKWDGSGYPRGLKEEQIPIAARLFAVVDVWDALRSDRPYRAGWSEEKVRQHIISLSGTHFDPKAVEIFLDVTAGSISRLLTN